MSGSLAKKVPVIMQMEATECGAASLAMVLAYYGRWVPLEKAREECGVSRDGSKAINILKAARKYGMEADAYAYTLEGVQEVEQFPCILYWNFNHFVVLCGFKGKYAYLNDPARGAVKVTMEEFDQSFTGIALCMKPTDAFEKGGAPKSVLSFAKERLAGMTGSLVLIALCCAIITLTSIVFSSVSRIFLDYVLQGEAPQWLGPISAILFGSVLVRCMTELIHADSINRVRSKFAVVGSSRFMWHLLHLPLGFFQQRHVGDLQQRQSSNETIASTLVESLAPTAINAVLLVVYLCVMLSYSWELTLVALVAVTLNAIAAYSASKMRLNLTRQRMRDSSMYHGATMGGIESIESIKASGAEQGYFERWAGHQALLNDADVRFTRINVLFGAIPQFVARMGNVSILLLGTHLIMTGELTIGMLLAFQGFFSNFLAPVGQIVGLGQRFQEMRSNMERIEDVLEYPADVEEEPDRTGEVGGKLAGAVELDHISFGYSPLEPPLIKDFSLSVKPGQWIALVGASGSGKSTIAKILCGLYEPWEGQVRFDGVPLRQIEPDRLRGSLAVVDQEISMFEDTISANIRLWDRSIEDFEVILAARDADIHDDIMARDAGYRGRVLQGGRNFSGGQLQRIEIARALASDPSILVLDEATSALDARTEAHVMQALRHRGITCIVVAHRLSTIRDCDEIIVLKDGEAVERGTHEQLLELGGAYQELVRSN